jgi:FAD/FMN-containing dehydrogenase
MSNITSAPPGFGGPFVGPDHPDYAEDRKAHFRQFDRRPAVIARCASSEDVSLAVRHAREHGLEIAVRAGGHSLPGYSTTEGGVLIDLRNLKGVEIEPTRARARVQPGVTGAEFVTAASSHGMAPVSGWDPRPAYVGLAIHGGRGALSRRYGWASDHIRSARLITADGTAITVSEEEHPDLLYGLRGAGSNFGIVTELEVDVVAIPPKILAGNLIYDHAEIELVARGVLEGLQDGLSDDLGVMMAVFGGPEGKPLLEIKIVHAGEARIAEADVDRIRGLASPIDGEILSVHYADFIGQSEMMPFDRWEWEEQGSELAPAELAAALVAEAKRFPVGENPEVPNCFFGLEPSGPGSQRATDLPTPVPRRAHTALFCFAAWSSPSEDEERIRWTHDAAKRLRSQGIGNDVPILNYSTVTGPDGVKRAYGQDAYRTLQRLKATYDPENVFHRNHNVEPLA